MWITSYFIAKLIPLFGLETVIFTHLLFRKTESCGQLGRALRYRQGIEQDSLIRLIASRVYCPHRTQATSEFSYRSIPGAHRAAHNVPLPVVYMPLYPASATLLRLYLYPLAASRLLQSFLSPYAYVHPLPNPRIRLNRFNGFRTRRAF